MFHYVAVLLLVAGLLSGLALDQTGDRGPGLDPAGLAGERGPGLDPAGLTGDLGPTPDTEG